MNVLLYRVGGAVLLSFLVFVPSGDLHCRDKLPHQYGIIAWTTDQGLPDNFVHDILQTRDGFLWIATEGGLCRFDGVTFTQIDRRSHPILLTNRISALLEDSKGHLWFGTHGGGLYRLVGDSISRITHEMGLPSDYILAIAEDSAGAIWVGTDGKGLGRILPDTIIQYSEAVGVSRIVNSLFLDSTNVLWIGTASGIRRYKDGALSDFQENHLLPSQEIRDFFEHNGTIWVATTAGLAVIHRGDVQTVHVIDKSLHVRSVVRDRARNLWIGTRQDGVYRISSDSASHFVYGDPAKTGDVTVVYLDREGNIWIGTERAGLIRLRNEVFTPFTTLDGLPDDFATSVTEGNGRMWFGTVGGLVSFAKERVRTYYPGQLPFDKLVQSVCVDSQGAVWCGTRSGHLMKMIGDRFVDVSLPGLTGASIWAVYPDRRGALWVGTQRGLFHLYGKTIVRYTRKDGGLSNDDVRTICEDRHGTLWFGTSYGLNEFTNGRFRQHTWKTGLSNDVVASLYSDAEGDMWVGTLGGLNRLRKGKAASITMEHGLPDDAIACILEDDLGHLWIGGSKGISRISKADLNAFLDGDQSSFSIRVFGTASGLRDVRVRTAMQPTAWKASDGTLWFATDGGIVSVDPARVKPNPVPPQVHIVQVRVDRVTKGMHSAGTTTDLGSAHDEVEIVYSAPTFIDPARVMFRYKLEGLNTDWVEAGMRRAAFFSKIPAGEYIFTVQAGNEEGLWNESGASLLLIVRPPFWMTWWFRSIVLVVFLSVGPAIYFRRVRQLKRRHAQQQEFSKRLIALQEAERKRIAAELHDGLGQNIVIIKNRALLGKQAGKDTGVISEQLDEISRTAAATLDDMRKIAHNLRPLNLERFGLTETIIQTVSDVGSAAGIPLQTNIDNIDKLFAPEVEMHLFRIVQEGLNNIVKHAQTSTGSVSIEKMNGIIRLTVQDDGRGFDTATGYHTPGFGLDDIVQRVNLIGGELLMDSMPGRGTTMIVYLPLPEKTS